MSDDFDALRKRLVANQPAYTHSAYRRCRTCDNRRRAKRHHRVGITPEPPKGT